jgi:hypothetical protein
MPKRVDQSGANSPTFKWTEDEIYKEALKYTDKRSFKKGTPRAYDIACNRGILDIICAHMPRVSNKAYTSEELYSIANKYSTLKEFRDNHQGAYVVAVRRDDWDQIRSHMKRSPISSPEKILLNEIQKYFPNAKKFRAKKLEIPGKKYIKTLEVDILVKESGRAIEFDGKWHHSLEGLRRGHPTWPEEDLKKYHDIKDDAFLSLGIKILHIKEEEWKKNKQMCVSKCLEFLGEP